jgi:hypothetical protein
MSGEIRVKEEDGVMVFEKDKTDDLEIKFYNPGYFSSIGFPEAEIKMVYKSTGEPVNQSAVEENQPLPVDGNAFGDSSGEETPSDAVEPSDATEETVAPENGAPEETAAPENGAPDSPAVENEMQTEETPIGQEEVATSPEESSASEEMNTTLENGVSEETTVPDEGVTEDNLDSGIEQNVPSDNSSELQEDATEPASDMNAQQQQDAEIKGGYYENVESLTVPFRHFVYLIQPENGKPQLENGKPSLQPADTTTSTNQSVGIGSFFDRIKSVFSKRDIPDAAPVQSESTNPLLTDLPKDEEAVPVQEPTVTPPENVPDDGSIMWVVRIPITENGELEKNAKHEKELKQIIAESNAEKANNIKVTGERYSIGNKTIKMAKKVEEGYEPPEYPKSLLFGSRMHKYSKLNENKSRGFNFFGLF